MLKARQIKKEIKEVKKLNQNIQSFKRKPKKKKSQKDISSIQNLYKGKKVVGHSTMMRNTHSIQKLAARYQHSYARSVVVPEFGRGSKIPSIFPQPTTSTHKHITVPFNVSVNGKAAIVFNPFFLADSAARSTLYVNNSATLNLTTVEATTGYTALSTPFGMTVNTCQSYRLVSASIAVVPQMSRQLASGTIAGGVCNYDLQITAGNVVGTNSFLFAGDLTLSSNVDNLLYFNKANVTDLESIRHIYFPFDPTYESYVPINGTHGTLSQTDFYFAYYVTGAPASSSFNIEIYLNYEWIPTPLAQAIFPMETYQGDETANSIIKALSGNEQLVTQVSPNLLGDLEKFETMEKGNSLLGDIGSFAKDAAGFVSENMSTILPLLRSVFI